MSDVTTDGSSVQDAGKATEQTDSTLDSKEQPSIKAEEDESSQASTLEEIEEPKESEEEPENGESEEEEGEVVETEEDEKADYLQDKSQKHAARKIQEVTSELAEAKKRLQEFEETQEQLVRNDANYLYRIAKSDKTLANKLVAKIYGESHGVDTLEELEIIAQREKAEDQYKPLFDTQLETLRELRELREEKAQRKEREQEEAMEKFKAQHPDFIGNLKGKALEIQKRSSGAFSLEESYEMAKGLVATKNPESLRKEGEERAIIKIAKNKAGTRGGGESKAKTSKVKALTPEQITLAKRFGNDPAKVY